jgi:hypothetical protein
VYCSCCLSGLCADQITTTPADFAVDGDKRCWLHIAIDRFDGAVVGQQLEEVLE